MGWEPLTFCRECDEPFDVYAAPGERVCESCKELAAWECPINFPGCDHNCGNYGCGNISPALHHIAAGRPPKSPSFPNGLSGNRTEAEVRASRRLTIVDVINQGARIPAPMGSYELQLIREHKLQQRLFAAIEEMRSAISEVNRMSAFVKVDAETFDNHVHDDFPSLASWQEKIQEAEAEQASTPRGIW